MAGRLLNGSLYCYSYEVTKNCTLCKMAGSPPHFAIHFCAWLDNHFSGGWIGRGVPTEQPSSRPDLTACGVGPKRRSADQNQEHFMNWNNKLEIIFALFSWLLKKKCWVRVFQVAEERAKCRSMCWDMTLNVCKILQNWSNAESIVGATTI